MNKTLIQAAIASVLGTVSFTAQAALTTGAVLSIDTGVKECSIGGTFPNCTYGVSDVTSGSYFSMDTNSDGSVPGNEKTVLTMNDGIAIGTSQAATGSHSGSPDGSESPGIDAPWLFFSNTGMHFSNSNVNATDNGGGNFSLDFSGWNVTWNGIAAINMGSGGTASLVCSTVACSAGATYVLDYAAVVPDGDPSGFGNVAYTLHLEGTVGEVSAVPVPAAAWLFGSGLIGLVGVARRKARA